jgi:hypothetical protein
MKGCKCSSPYGRCIWGSLGNRVHPDYPCPKSGNGGLPAIAGGELQTYRTGPLYARRPRQQRGSSSQAKLPISDVGECVTQGLHRLEPFFQLSSPASKLPIAEVGQCVTGAGGGESKRLQWQATGGLPSSS